MKSFDRKVCLFAALLWVGIVGAELTTVFTRRMYGPLFAVIAVVLWILFAAAVIRWSWLRMFRRHILRRLVALQCPN